MQKYGQYLNGMDAHSEYSKYFSSCVVSPFLLFFRVDLPSFLSMVPQCSFFPFVSFEFAILPLSHLPPRPTIFSRLEAISFLPLQFLSLFNYSFSCPEKRKEVRSIRR